MRVIYFGDGGSVFSNRLFHALTSTNAEIRAVIDAPKRNWRSTNTADTGKWEPCTDWAGRRGIPLRIGEDPNGEAALRFFADCRPDLYIAVGYNRLLKDRALSIPRLGAVNFHASLLPAYRGKHPLYWALKNKEPLAGLTVHFMDPGLDTGDILYQVRVPVRENDTVAGLYSRIMDKSTELMDRLIEDARKGSLSGVPQEAFPWKPSYYSSIPEEEET